jgi:hypothetical protein
MRHTADPGPSVDSLRRTVLLRAHLLRRDSASAADAVLLEVLDAPVVTIHLLHRGERGASCVQHPPLPFGVPIVRLAGCWLTPYPRLCSETRSTGRISAAPSPSYPSSSPPLASRAGRSSPTLRPVCWSRPWAWDTTSTSPTGLAATAPCVGSCPCHMAGWHVAWPRDTYHDIADV